jgi:hypothetical protein
MVLDGSRNALILSASRTKKIATLEARETHQLHEISAFQATYTQHACKHRFVDTRTQILRKVFFAVGKLRTA